MIKRLAACLGLLLAAACASGPQPHVPYEVMEYVKDAPDQPSVKIGPPYRVMGEKYFPKDDPDYAEVGLASWYGPNFHGKSTANGERFNQWALTAAHKTLPMPSIVRVTDLDTNKSVIVRVNDRGPFAKGRIIDLSRAAAEELGIRGKGVAEVRVEFLKDLTEEFIAKNNFRPAKKPIIEYDVASKNKSKPTPAPVVASVASRDDKDEENDEFDTVSNESSEAMSHPIPDFAGDNETTLDVRGVKMEEIGYAEDAFAVLDREAPPAPKAEKAYGAQYASTATPVATDSQPLTIHTVSYSADDKKPDVKKNTEVAAKPTSENPAAYFIQVGVFKQQTNAYGLAKKLADVAAADVEEFTLNDTPMYRVKLGPTMNRETAEELLDRLPTHGVKDAKIVRKH